MVNICELLINVVSSDKPNGLIGLNQKVSDQVWILHFYPSQILRHRRIGKT